MRRFGWQIGGITVAVVMLGALGFVAFRPSAASPVAVASPTPRATVRATPTADPRVAQVEDAARGYVQALADAMRTASPSALDALTVPGSQAQGNAGVPAHVARNTGKTFLVTAVTYQRISTELASTTAVVTVDYTFTGFDAKWPSLQPLSSAHAITTHDVLEFDLIQGQWLVASSN